MRCEKCGTRLNLVKCEFPFRDWYLEECKCEFSIPEFPDNSVEYQRPEPKNSYKMAVKVKSVTKCHRLPTIREDLTVERKTGTTEFKIEGTGHFVKFSGKIQDTLTGEILYDPRPKSPESVDNT